MKMRIASFLFALMLLLTLLPNCEVPVSAAYENTYTNTGDQAADILGVALTQVGYVEGYGNITKYGNWYGMNGEAWCGMFVSWCANQAGIPTSVLPKYARSNPEGWGLTRLDGAKYRPKPGDLFFKKSLTHVGLVYYLDGDYFYTLEGNAGSEPHSVCIRKRLIKDYYFGSPKYKGGADHNYTTAYETAHPHKEYRYCSGCSDKYYTGKTQTVADCIECIQAACSHTYSSWTESGTQHTRTCSKCAKKETKNHNWNTGTITIQPTCAKTGSKDQTCKDCGAQRTTILPKTDSHKFKECEYVDEVNHQKTCSVCKKVVTEAHADNAQWSSDHMYHWYDCDLCNDRYQQQEHDMPDGCESPCTICQYISEVGHILSDSPSYDEKEHWQSCTVCSQQTQRSEHHFSAECDEVCDGCEFRRETTHSFSETLMGDANGHWSTCTLCQATTELAAHTPDTSVPDWLDQPCLDCGYIVRSASEHQHQYDVCESDGDCHWGQCACGEEMPIQAHNWSMRTQACTVCERSVEEPVDNAPNLIIWIAIIGGSCLLISGISILCVHIARKKRLVNV